MKTRDTAIEVPAVTTVTDQKFHPGDTSRLANTVLCNIS